MQAFDADLDVLELTLLVGTDRDDHRALADDRLLELGDLVTPDFVFDNYARFLTTFFGSVLGFSLLLAILVAVCCVVIAFPFTYLLTKRPRAVQTLWLVGLLSVLSLSEVIIGFAWSTLFSRTAGKRSSCAISRVSPRRTSLTT